MRRLLYLAALAMVASLVLAPAALAQVRGPSGADGTFNCPDFDTQGQAQSYYESQGGLSGSNPSDLDADLDGQACEDSLPGAEPEGGTMMSDTTTPTEEPSTITSRGADTVPLNPDGTCPEGFVTVNAPFCAEESPNTPGRIFGFGEGDLATPTASEEQYVAPATPATPAPSTQTTLPDTGGPALLLPAAGLLLASGLLGLGIVRRRL